MSRLLAACSLVTALALTGCGPTSAGDPDGGPPAEDAGTSGTDGGETTDGGDVTDGGAGLCDPNPCTDEHRTRCLTYEGGFECRCDVGYHDSDGLCCQTFSQNIGGQCTCYLGYTEDETGACVVECSENTIEGLDGWCPDDGVCVQGVCIVDLCVDVTCPEGATCVIRADEAFCQCDDGLHLSGDLCCQLNASDVGGTCTCDDGYVDQGGACVPDQTNPCFAGTCADAGLHRETCVVDDSAAGYHCACNQGYEDQDGACVLTVWETCPTGTVCRADVCVPTDLSNEQCLTDDDCHEYFAEAPTFCNEAAAGGICLGCIQHSDCPGNTQCNDYGTCALMCDDDSDCHYGRCYTATGFCGQARCTSDADCAGGTVCIDDGGDGQGLCLRIPCTETACSPTNPNGTCAGAGEACLYGACVSTCDPNPCTEELNKNVCTLSGGVPVCTCAAGYELAADGRCVPATAPCPEGFTCGADFCADTAAAGFVCSTDGDCGAGLTCSPSLPSGTCSGCGVGAPCPGNLVCLSGYCLQPCTLHTDCHAEMICRGTGYCGRKACAGPDDCAAPYLCVADTDGGTCRRPACEVP